MVVPFRGGGGAGVPRGAAGGGVAVQHGRQRGADVDVQADERVIGRPPMDRRDAGGVAGRGRDTAVVRVAAGGVGGVVHKCVPWAVSGAGGEIEERR